MVRLSRSGLIFLKPEIQKTSRSISPRLMRTVDLTPKGSGIPVMRDNKLEYIPRVSHHRPQSKSLSKATDFSTRSGSSGCTCTLDTVSSLYPHTSISPPRGCLIDKIFKSHLAA
ncbi:hypothetical protein BJY52DRAFT_1296461 [Lactarius psammicola]|nr:hypothetical protein BJY52DRAFT_1296461 [Lactarius psammicola]